MARRKNEPESLEAKENELIRLATQCAEKKLRDGTAPVSLIQHYLKLGTTREQLEQERLRHETELARAKTESIHVSRERKESYDELLKTFRLYNGQASDEEYDEYDD